MADGDRSTPVASSPMTRPGARARPCRSPSSTRPRRPPEVATASGAGCGRPVSQGAVPDTSSPRPAVRGPGRQRKATSCPPCCRTGPVRPRYPSATGPGRLATIESDSLATTAHGGINAGAVAGVTPAGIEVAQATGPPPPGRAGLELARTTELSTLSSNAFSVVSSSSGSVRRVVGARPPVPGRPERLPRAGGVSETALVRLSLPGPRATKPSEPGGRPTGPRQTASTRAPDAACPGWACRETGPMRTASPPRSPVVRWPRARRRSSGRSRRGRAPLGRSPPRPVWSLELVGQGGMFG
jgi:hypothetical protein